jgi:hypothetical protein
VGRGRERVALIKSLTMQDRKDVLEALLQKIELNLSADNTHKIGGGMSLERSLKL